MAQEIKQSESDSTKEPNRPHHSLASISQPSFKSDYDLETRPSVDEPKRKWRTVIDKEDVDIYRDLGLGRGVNVTTLHMWKSKSSFVVRRIDPEGTNIIGTEESGIKKSYIKEVSIVSMHQENLCLSLNNPHSQVKIGIDCQVSQSTQSSIRISGTKVNTRTIAFKEKMSKHNSCIQSQGYNKEDDFEENLYKWLLSQMKTRVTYESNAEPQTQSSQTPILNDECNTESQTQEQLAEKDQEELSNIVENMLENNDVKSYEKIVADCGKFIRSLGVTHYVSAIKLGAVSYTAIETNIKQAKLGVGSEVSIGPLAKGGVLAQLSSLRHYFWFEDQQIGRIVNGKVERRTPDEAVIGIKIQTVSHLVRIHYVQIALQEAITQYIEAKNRKSGTLGPFKIFCETPKKVYWTVHRSESGSWAFVNGTTNSKNASTFYIVPIQDEANPSDFYIVHRREIKPDTPLRDRFHRADGKKAPHSLYLSNDSGCWGEGRLTLQQTVEIKKARFCLYSSDLAQACFSFWCRATPPSWKDIEDPKQQLYINCCNHAFKRDVCIAMRKKTKSSEYEAFTTPTREAANTFHFEAKATSTESNSSA